MQKQTLDNNEELEAWILKAKGKEERKMMADERKSRRRRGKGKEDERKREQEGKEKKKVETNLGRRK